MSKKGELRARLAAELLAAHARGDVRLAAGRASDFYGPGARLAAIFGDRFWQRVLAGKAGESLGDPEMKHSYSYVDDVAAGLATLGAGEAALGKVWHLPVAPAEPTRRTIERMFQALDRPAKVTALLTLVLRFAGLFAPILREVAEMAYQWTTPFVLDDSRFRAAFGGTATPLEAGCAATVAWAKTAYAPAR